MFVTKIKCEKSSVADPGREQFGSGMEKSRIRDKHPRAVDPDCFDADPDPDPAQTLDADPDPHPGGGGVGLPKICIPPSSVEDPGS